MHNIAGDPHNNGFILQDFNAKEKNRQLKENDLLYEACYILDWEGDFYRERS